jgi:arginyl-tRNA synthetase
MMEERIREATHDALKDVGAEAATFTVERPADLSYGDYATNAALVAAKQLGRVPQELASELAGRIERALGDAVANVVVAGPGFLNISLSRSEITGTIAQADAQGAQWGKRTTPKDTRVLIEYSNPNAFKEMHVGHLVGTIIGESISRLVAHTGVTVARDTFGGDIGPNVAKALWGLQQNNITEPTTPSEIGDAYARGSIAYESDPKAKEEIDALNQAIYTGTDHELMELWRKGRDVSMSEFRRIWKLLGTHFDFEFFDSDTTETGLRVVRDGLAKGIFQKSDGAVIYNGEEKGVHTMVFITSHDTPTYETKDIGLALLKEERWPSDSTLIVTGNEQVGRFKTVLAALTEVAPLLAAKTKVIATGFLKLSSGQKMSSREGNVITAADFIREVIEKAGEKNSDPLIAEQVAIGAIAYMILRQAPGSDILFDKEKSLSLEGDSGPYLQYALVRAKSVLSQSSEKGKSDTPQDPYPIERVILHFPEVLERAASLYAPNLLVNYLTELAGEWNSFYAKERIIGGEHESHKLMVARAFVQTMTNGLTLLGIPTPEKM